MRKLFAVAMAAGLVGLGGFVRDANAGLTIDLLFTEINAGAIAPTNTIGVGVLNPGDQITMAVLMSNDEPLKSLAFSLNYDLGTTEGVNDGLDMVSVFQWAGVFTAMNGDKFSPLGALSAPTSTFAGSFQGFTTNLARASQLGSGYQMGTVTWTYTGDATSNIDILSGLFNFGIDVTGDSFFNELGAAAVFNSATILVPEPGTAALLGLGLVGLVLAGRRQRD